MNSTHKKGFSLIELLVVIAIIGILTSVVLVNVNQARMKGIDASIKLNLNNARAEASVYYEDNFYSYEYLCTEGIEGFLEAAEAAGSLDVNCFVPENGESWAAEGQLRSDATTYFCVDHDGFAGTVPESRVETDEDYASCGA